MSQRGTGWKKMVELWIKDPVAPLGSNMDKFFGMLHSDLLNANANLRRYSSSSYAK
ncbi:hypothetical protein AcW2_006423 [Taiwanofungus camphoratus]|nr:hypothetical protein AcW2_006423 [Antrodia cinnamomea]